MGFDKFKSYLSGRIQAVAVNGKSNPVFYELGFYTTYLFFVFLIYAQIMLCGK